MDTPRRTFLQLAAGAASVPLFASAAGAAPASRDSRLMGQAKFIDVNGIRTRYFDGGSGGPLVLVHGGQWPSTASADTWAPIFDHLAARFHVYAVDKLGMGFTDNPKTEADFSMDAITDHTYGFIQAVGIRRAALVGHSRGALPLHGSQPIILSWSAISSSWTATRSPRPIRIRRNASIRKPIANRRRARS